MILDSQAAGIFMRGQDNENRRVIIGTRFYHHSHCVFPGLVLAVAAHVVRHLHQLEVDGGVAVAVVVRQVRHHDATEVEVLERHGAGLGVV